MGIASDELVLPVSERTATPITTPGPVHDMRPEEIRPDLESDPSPLSDVAHIALVFITVGSLVGAVELLVKIFS
jgi:hypothetical protein